MPSESDEFYYAETETMNTVSYMLYHDNEQHRKIWLIKRMLARLQYLEIDIRGKFKQYSHREICQYIGEYFGLFAHSLGGWGELRDCITSDVSKRLREMTFDQARRGFAVGSILEKAIENGGNISDACRHVLNTLLIEDKIIITNTTYKTKKTYKYKSEDGIRNKLWYNNRCVAHLWLAAKSHYADASDFADRMYFDLFPFNTKPTHEGFLSGYAEFVEHSQRILENAINYSGGLGDQRKALLDVERTLFAEKLKK